MSAVATPTCVASTSAARPVAGSHANAVDGLRFIAALAIVWIHVPRTELLYATTVLARFAVPFFVFSAAYFATSSGLKKTSRSVVQYARQRAQRIYVPFLVWSAMYLAFKWVKLLLLPDQPNDFPGWSFFLVGSAYHLWFLPFILAASVSAFAIGRSIGDTAYAKLHWIYFFNGAILAMLDVELWPIQDGLKFMVDASPAMFWAVGFALLVHTYPGRKQLPTWILTCLLGVSMLLLAINGRQVFVENAAGSLLFVVALRGYAFEFPSFLRKLAPLAFGVYLSHLLMIKAIESLCTKLQLSPSIPLDLATYILAVVGSITLTYCLANSRKFAWVV